MRTLFHSVRCKKFLMYDLNFFSLSAYQLQTAYHLAQDMSFISRGNKNYPLQWVYSMLRSLLQYHLSSTSSPPPKKKLQSRESAKRAATVWYDDYTTPPKVLFQRLNWLTVAQRTDHNKAVLVYKCVHKLLLEYMNDVFSAPTTSN